MGERRVEYVTDRDIAWAKIAVKAAKREGTEPDPLMVRIANAQDAPEPDRGPERIDS